MAGKRKLWTFESSALRLQVAPGGGHIAGVYLKNGHPKAKRLPNPLWTPPWKSMEPQKYKPRQHDRIYGGAPEGRLLSGILGHNLALDTYGTPSPAEVKQGAMTHGEAGVLEWKRRGAAGFSVRLPVAQLEAARRIEFHKHLAMVRVQTTVRNFGVLDRPISWAEHVTFGPPFLAPQTHFEVPARRALVYPGPMGPDSLLEVGREFVWPSAPTRLGGTLDWRRPPAAKRAADFTALLLETPSNLAWFTAINPKLDYAIGYLFRRSDFPWIGIWDEKYSRVAPPWKRRTWARGLEFSTTPLPMSRRGVIDMGKLFGVPTFRWVEAKGEISVPFVIYAGKASDAELFDQAVRFLNL